jgi:hypothetical protein
MTDQPRIVCRSLTNITPDQGQDTRSRAWLYVFERYSRREGLEGGPTTTPKDDTKESINDGAARTNCNK